MKEQFSASIEFYSEKLSARSLFNLGISINLRRGKREHFVLSYRC